MATPRATARAGEKYRPPSENESGVTFKNAHEVGSAVQIQTVFIPFQSEIHET
jgi:hypothetical protein